MNNFEDVVVFCMDVERCLAKLNPREKDLIRRVALQEYTQAEAAAVLGFSRRFVVQQYGMAVDRVTTMFLEDGLMDPLKSCQ
jgi:DNA-directed RNA polymerase specialized sigma24 family protein